jgi:hypothetical protein
LKLAVGAILILIFMSIVHVIYGEKMQVDVLKKLNANPKLLGSFRVMLLQGSLLLCAVGVVKIFFYTKIIKNGFAAFILVGVICLNVLSVLIVALIKHRELFKPTIPLFLIFSTIIILQMRSLV